MNCRKITNSDTAERQVSTVDNLPESHVSSNRTMRNLTGKDHTEETRHQLYTIYDIVPNAIQILLY
jgi:hypothetical protein